MKVRTNCQQPRMVASIKCTHRVFVVQEAGECYTLPMTRTPRGIRQDINKLVTETGFTR